MILPALMVLVSVAGGDQDQKDFVAANEKALAGDHPAAAALYGHLLSRGVTHEDVYFNLGTSAARAGKLLEAVVAYERALAVEPEDADARHNLSSIRARLRPKDREASGSVHGTDLILSVIGGIPRRPLRWLAVGSHALIYLFWFFRARSRSDVARSRLGMGLLFTGLIFATSALVAVGHEVAAHEVRAVALEAAPVREGPHERYAEASKLYAGEPLRVLARDSDWAQVRGEDGRTGWLSQTSIEVVAGAGR
ncbi:MAG: SH3 domain-containing protein [Deltaproteobacteria bacterium]|nr:SH3 domain-containing protein [Deltaproteobacteria bacterium]